jgi:CHAT domain-containing protein/Tfp pilus assembly protein PilF
VIALAVAALTFVLPAAEPCPRGVVVESVEAGFALARAGLKPGDLLCGWERAASPPANTEPSQGAFVSAFDLDLLENEQAPRGPVTLWGTRDGEAFRLLAPPGDWKARTRPILEGLVPKTQEEESALAQALREAGRHLDAAWLFHRSAVASIAKRDWKAADVALEEALRDAEAARDAVARARIHRTRGGSFEERSAWDQAAGAYGQVLEIERSRAGGLGEALALYKLGGLAFYRADLAAAQEHLEGSLAIRERLAPGSLPVAAALQALGSVRFRRGDVPAADAHLRRALAIQQRLDPQGPAEARMLNVLGLIAETQGDLLTAESFLKRGFAIAAGRERGTLTHAAALHNLGLIAFRRSDLATAEDLFLQALTIEEAHGPESLNVANSLNSLAAIAGQRNDSAAEESYHRRALRIREKLAPGSLEIAESLHGLALVCRKRGDLPAAEAHWRQALAIQQEQAPESRGLVSMLNELGDILLEREKAPQARETYERAMAIAERTLPRGVYTANTLGRLGDLALTEGDLALAETYLRRSLDIRRDLSPGSAHEAQAYLSLARLARRQERWYDALALYRSAVESLDTQRRRLGGRDEAKGHFAAKVAGPYQEVLAFLVERGLREEAFAALERYRARALLALLAERELVFAGDVPEELDRERRQANTEYDRALARLSAAKEADLPQAQEALTTIRLRQAEIGERIRKASPRLAALQSPEPLDLAGARGVLDPGTLLLSYSIGPDKSHLFAVGPGAEEFRVIPLDTSAAALRSGVGRLRELLQQQAALQRRQLDRLGRSLSATLLRPVAGELRRAQRLVVLPDGPLHVLPFAMLADPNAPGRHLVEALPLHVAASATVFAELRKSRRPPAAVRLVAFGDPDYSAVSAAAPADRAAPELRSARTHGLALNPLPASRREVEDLRRLFPDASRLYLGGDATEQQARAAGREATILHFACHALADEGSPLDSSLALSIPADWKPGQPNGLLQAWEIFEQVRIDADLVTLSACGTALGKEMSGEGILGLTRAFQYAGARTVLASLWAVRDDSTAELMRRFYRHLRDGQSKDAALRAAQIEMIRGRSSHPGRWAAFQLIGDWR